MPSVHGPLTSPTTGTGLGVYAGRLSFTTGSTGIQTATVTDSNFTSKIIRASNHIILSAANLTASALYSTTVALGVYARMTNNASIIVGYFSLGVQTPIFYFQVFSGGTNT